MRWQPLLLLILTGLLAVAVVKTAGGTFMPDEDTGQLQVQRQCGHQYFAGTD